MAILPEWRAVADRRRQTAAYSGLINDDPRITAPPNVPFGAALDTQFDDQNGGSARGYQSFLCRRLSRARQSAGGQAACLCIASSGRDHPLLPLSVPYGWQPDGEA
jgi:hypothetical protein